ncbi:MAG: chromosome segregation protein SMC [Lachnospiraceae bacterium]|nr:chromosome segregation protein SMC [Lachnospiraceae bacterium]
MYLKSIEIHGFKSFADKIKLDFKYGITGIVGPNGSGKSNVSDAVRWVLGEQSARQLRGASMQDVIFAGTEIRKPMGYAYVTITMDNSDHVLAAEYDEVSVTRRVYRSGESDYLINGNPVRLRDINELFYDTGIGQDGYSIIGQGKIDQILSGKPEERRELFDEACGIVKFRKRKDTAVKKLESEKANLLRLTDILSEVEGRVGPLQKQSEDAKVYLDKKEKLKKLDVNIFLAESERYEGQLAELNGKYDSVMNDIDGVERELSESHSKYAEAGEKIEELDHKIEDMRKEISDTTLKRGQIDSQIQVLKEQINSLITSTEHYKGRDAEIRKTLEKHAGELEKLNETKADIDKKIEEAEASGSGKNEELASFDKRIAEASEGAEAKKQLVLDTIAGRGALKGEKERLATLLSQAEIRKAELSSRLLKAKSSEAEAKDAIDAMRKEMEGIQDKIKELGITREEQEKKLSDINEEIDNAVESERQLQTAYTEEKTRLESLKNIAERYEGYGNAVRFIMDRKRDKSSGICGVVADLIKVDHKYETAIETALGANIQNVVVEDDTSAKKLIAMLKEQRAGRVTFLPLNTIQERDFKAKDAVNETGVIGMADTLVRMDKKYDIVAKNLLGNFIVVDNIDNALALARKYRFTLRVVTLAGESLNPGGSMAGGFFRNQSNLLGRSREIDELTATLKQKLADRDKILQKIEELRDNKSEIRNALQDITDEMQKESLRLNTANMNLNLAEEKRSENQSGSEGISSEARTLEDEIASIKSEQEANENKLKESETIEKDADEEAARLDGLIKTLTEESMTLRKEVGENDIRMTQLKEQQGYAAENISRVEGERLRLESELTSITESLAKNDEDTVFKQDQIKSLEETLLNAGEFDSKKQEELKALIESRDEATKVQKKLYEDRDSINERKAGLDREKIRIENQREKLNENTESRTKYMWDEYNLTLIASRELKDDTLGDLSTMRQESMKLKSEIRNLGDVNVGAIEEYRELSERYEFLTKQRDDIIHAEEDLNTIITELTESMRKQFIERFREIEKQFDIVFGEMFGGGHGTLTLTDEEDVLDAGINIIARPPGKKLQNMMQLSGGEKALTAIALLFAIQNLKPSPFCLLDEIEAALDEANVDRFASYLSKLTEHTQFIVITHRRGTMTKCDRLYGITMQEKGVSTQVAVNLEDSQWDDDNKTD